MSRPTSVTITVTVMEEEYEVSGNCYPGSPGKLHGLPENCYPAEPAEAEIDSVTFNGKPFDLKKFLAMEEVNVEDIESKLLEAAADSCDDYDGPDPDDWYDDRFDREDDREFNERYDD